MTLKLEDKKAIVTEVNNAAGVALSAAVADYRGLSVSQMDNLRANARKSGIYLKVVRNTLAKRAVVGTDFECMQNAFVGSLVLAFANEEPGAAAKLFKDFAKVCDKLEVKNLAIGGEIYGPEKLDEMSKLPNRKQALSMLCNVMQAPITKFARTVNEIPSSLVRVVKAVGDSK